MEAVKQGSATVGLKSKTHAVLIALKRARYFIQIYYTFFLVILNKKEIGMVDIDLIKCKIIKF